MEMHFQLTVLVVADDEGIWWKTELIVGCSDGKKAADDIGSKQM